MSALIMGTNVNESKEGRKEVAGTSHQRGVYRARTHNI